LNKGPGRLTTGPLGTQATGKQRGQAQVGARAEEKRELFSGGGAQTLRRASEVGGGCRGQTKLMATTQEKKVIGRLGNNIRLLPARGRWFFLVRKTPDSGKPGGAQTAFFLGPFLGHRGGPSFFMFTTRRFGWETRARHGRRWVHRDDRPIGFPRKWGGTILKNDAFLNKVHRTKTSRGGGVQPGNLRPPGLRKAGQKPRNKNNGQAE